MANFWLAKTKAEIKAIPSASIENGARIWNIETQTMFRYFKYRNFSEISWYSTVFYKPTDLADNTNGVWQNEGDIYQNRSVAFGEYVLFNIPPFPPATPNQKIISSWTNPNVADEKFILEWIANYDNNQKLQFPDYNLSTDYETRSWRIYKIKSTICDRNPIVDYNSSGDGQFWYKTDENRLFFNSFKLMEDVKNRYNFYPQYSRYNDSTGSDESTWDELQFTNSLAL